MSLLRQPIASTSRLVPSLTSHLARPARATYSTPVTQPEDAAAQEPTAMEQSVLEKLKQRFPGGEIDVMDTSGRCGSAFAISVAHSEFAGLSTVKQHRLLSSTLKDEIKGWHAVQFKTQPK